MKESSKPLYVVDVRFHCELEAPFEAFAENLPHIGFVFEQEAGSDESVCKLFFEIEPHYEILYSQIESFFANLADIGFENTAFSAQHCITQSDNWLESWRAHFKRMQVSNRIVIVPPWEEYNKQREDEIVIVSDPGMAFGTGKHATTRFCLTALEERVAPGCSVLDIGCGSGILGIAAALLDAGEVDGFDNDPQALAHAQYLAELNHVEGKIRLFESDLEQFKPDHTYDIVVANLYAELLVSYRDSIVSSVKQKGILMLTGILDIKLDSVVNSYYQSGLKQLNIFSENEWRGLLFSS